MKKLSVLLLIAALLCTLCSCRRLDNEQVAAAFA